MQGRWILVNIDGEPVDTRIFVSQDEAEKAARAEWAKGLEVYVQKSV